MERLVTEVRGLLWEIVLLLRYRLLLSISGDLPLYPPATPLGSYFHRRLFKQGMYASPSATATQASAHVLLQAVEPLSMNLCMAAAENKHMPPPATPATEIVALGRM